MTRSGRAGRLRVLEAAQLQGATEHDHPDITDPAERGALWVRVCALWCLTSAQRDEFAALAADGDHDDDALAMADGAIPQLRTYFADLEPPTERTALWAWERTWKERARDWAPPTPQEAAGCVT